MSKSGLSFEALPPYSQRRFPDQPHRLKWHAVSRLAGFAAVSLALAGSAVARETACAVMSPGDRSKPAVGRKLMVAAAHPMAAKAGCAVLRRGGTAIDAAVAVQAVLAVVEPQSSGLAGGTLITYWDNAKKRVRHFEGIARAPRGVGTELRTPVGNDSAACGLKPGKVLSWNVNFTARAFGVPGTLRVLDLAHKSLGREPWRTLFDDSIRIAETGYALPNYLRTLVGEPARPAGIGKGLIRCRYPDLRRRFCVDADTPKPVGTTIHNPEIARVLSLVRDGGAAAFYDPKGPIVAGILARTRQGACKLSIADGEGPVLATLLTAEDFAAYTAHERKPVCAPVLGHVVCSAPPPSFGGATVIGLLTLADRAGIRNHRPGSLQHTHIMLQASRLMQADRRHFLGDPDFKPMPLDGILSTAYLRDRARLIGSAGIPAVVAPGRLPSGGRTPALNDPAKVVFEDETSHVSIVDGYGNALAMTTTNNTSFGSQMEAMGMVLNNVLVNFTRPGSVSPGYEVNAMRPGARPRTAMAPTVVLDRNLKLRMVLGAAGGGAIPDYVAGTILHVLVHGMDPQAALAQPHTSGQALTSSRCDGGPGFFSDVEKGTALAQWLPELKNLGHACPRAVRLRSGLTAIALTGDGRILGAADPRRDGIAVGE
ncbi:MAG: gamma-glutamyltransferase [Hyphomicrobiaceae bacterium]|nr:gamma-glutamyltransferase [Hyphomicrobiaceae bacterium]